MKKWILRIMCLIVLLSLCLPLTVSAVKLNHDRASSLTLVYQYEGVAFEGLQIKTYLVADLGENVYDMNLTGQFADYPVNIETVQSQSEWNVICDTLEAYIWADGLQPDATAVTDASGTVKFEGLKPGLYLTMPVTRLTEEATTEFLGFLTVIPDPREDGTLNYDVTAYPKATQHRPQDDDAIVMRVNKQWKDTGYQINRPESIQVDIYRNGEFVSTVDLSAANNWSHGWVALDDGSVWSAVEREVPPEYTVTIETIGDTIIITNVREGGGGPPDSGDTFVFWPYILGMCISGCGIILLAVSKKKAKA